MISEKEIKSAERCLTLALEKGAQKARVYLTQNVSDSVGTLNGQIDKVFHSMDISLSMSLFVDGRYGTFATNRFEGLESFLDSAIDTVKMLAPDKYRDLPDPGRTAKDAVTGRELGLYDPEYEGITSEMRIERALSASIYDRHPEGLISEEGMYSDNMQDSVIMDTNGLFCRHTETSFDYSVEMTVQDSDGNRYSAFWWDSSWQHDMPWLKDVSPEALRRARAQMNPQGYDCGKFNVVLDTEVASKVVAPVLNSLSASVIQQNNSFMNGTLGKKVLPEGLTIIDDCRTPGKTGCRLFDGEGVATAVEPIIEKGVVKKYFVNTYFSGKMGMAPTVDDFTRPCIPGWPERGLDRDAILRLCGSGIYVTAFNGGNSNGATGDFSYGIEGFAFKDGKLLHPVREMLMTGNLLTLWGNLVAAGDDCRPCKSKLIPTLAFSDIDISA